MSLVGGMGSRSHKEKGLVMKTRTEKDCGKMERGRVLPADSRSIQGNAEKAPKFTWRSVTFCWMQGERDASGGAACRTKKP